MDQAEHNIFTVQGLHKLVGVTPWHVRVFDAMYDPHRAVRSETVIANQVGAALFDEPPGNGVGIIAIARGALKEALCFDCLASLTGKLLPHQYFSHVPGRGNQDRAFNGAQTLNHPFFIGDRA